MIRDEAGAGAEKEQGRGGSRDGEVLGMEKEPERRMSWDGAGAGARAGVRN